MILINFIKTHHGNLETSMETSWKPLWNYLETTWKPVCYKGGQKRKRPADEPDEEEDETTK